MTVCENKVCLYVCLSVCYPVYVFIYVVVYMFVSVFVYICSCVCTCEFSCLCVCSCVCSYMPLHVYQSLSVSLCVFVFDKNYFKPQLKGMRRALTNPSDTLSLDAFMCRWMDECGCFQILECFDIWVGACQPACHRRYRRYFTSLLREYLGSRWLFVCGWVDVQRGGRSSFGKGKFGNMLGTWIILTVRRRNMYTYHQTD